MKERVELNYAGYGWILTIRNDLIGEYSVDLPDNLAMSVALAISTAQQAGIQKGLEMAKKKYKSINDASHRNPWSDATTPMQWRSDWKLSDPRK